MPLQDILKVYLPENVSKIKNMREDLQFVKIAVEEWGLPVGIAVALCWHVPREGTKSARCREITVGILGKYKKIIKSKLNGKNKKTREKARK